VWKSSPKVNLRKVLSDDSASRCYFIRSLLLLLFLGFVGGTPAANADAQKPALASVGSGQPFAIADFDGDLSPDLASVQTGRSDSSRADYWIQFQLTTAGRQSFHVVASIGGLQVAARDVNGDHAVDLLLSTAFLNQPVAILLNDGRGNFTRASPSAFPGAFSESEANWAPGGNQVTGAVGVPPQARTGVFSETRGLPYPKAQVKFTPFSTKGCFLCPFLTSHLGRAPPSQSSRL